MKTALFVGRFQPFHMGHLKVIKWILKKYDKIVIVIGSSQEVITEKNPFTFNERKKMIKKTLENEKIEGRKYKIIGVPDVYDDKIWIKSILKKAKFDVVFTMNSWTRRCFDNYKIKVKKHPIFGNISGSMIRKMMKNDEKWEKLVPGEVEKVIKNRL
jgi:nicotinamide-nucleotide adenylyltransferase